MTFPTLSSQKGAQKAWWTPVRRGLVCDLQAKHYHRMKGAIWLFLYLLLHADRKTGVLFRKTKTISQDMHIPLGTIRDWLDRLKRQGYVTTHSSGKALVIQIRKWSTGNRITDGTEKKETDNEDQEGINPGKQSTENSAPNLTDSQYVTGKRAPKERRYRDSSTQSTGFSAPRVRKSQYGTENPAPLKSHSLAQNQAKVLKIQHSKESIFKNNNIKKKSTNHVRCDTHRGKKYILKSFKNIETMNPEKNFQKPLTSKNVKENSAIEDVQKKCWAYAFAEKFRDKGRLEAYKKLCLKYPLEMLSFAWQRLKYAPNKGSPKDPLEFLSSLLQKVSCRFNSNDNKQNAHESTSQPSNHQPPEKPGL